MHTFVGHRDVVLEFQWRPSRPDDSNLQLVTWSKDQTLLVWKIEPILKKLCGYEPDDVSFYDDGNLFRKNYVFFVKIFWQLLTK